VRMTRHKKADAMIPTASMADIAFLLIIFFMVTTVHDKDRTSVNLPEPRNRTEAAKGAALVVLYKDDQQNLVYKFSDGDNMSTVVSGPKDIYFEATSVMAKNSLTQFILKADGSVAFEKVDELLDTMRKAGVQDVLLLTAKKTVEEGVSL